MTLDTTQILILALVAAALLDKALVWYVVHLLAGGQRAQTFPVSPLPPIVVPPVVPPVGPGPDVPPVEPTKPPVVPDKPPVVVTPPVPPVPPTPTGHSKVLRGKCSWFGGPNDKGVKSDEGLALVERSDFGHGAWGGIFLPTQPPGTTGLARALNPDAHYIACRWVYTETSKKYLQGIKVTVKNPGNGKVATDVRPVDWGPNANTGRVADLSPGLMAFLGLNTDDAVEVDIPLPSSGPAQPDQPIQPPAPSVGSTVLQHNVWPTQAQVRAGALGDPHDTSQHVEVTCPWLLNGGKTKSITIHKMFAPSLSRCLNYIWEHPTVNKSQAWIDAHGYNVFDGSWNIRDIAGTSTPSMHAYAAAMDWNAAKNPQHAPETKTLFKTEKTEPPNGSLIIWVFEQEGWTCGIRWSPAYIDAMHIQGPRV